MNIQLFGSGIINTIKPYCKKHINSYLEAHEFMLLNTFLISTILSFYFIYLIFYDKTNVTDIYSKYTNLSNTQIFAIITLSLVTVISTIIGINADKKYNKSVTTNLMVKAFTTIIIIIAGIYLFEEKYTNYDFIGMILIIAGIYFINL